MRALIVDDQPNVRLLLSRILREKVGCTVSEATNGLEALDLLGRQPCDFIVLDVVMPLMDGIETLEVIRRTPALRHLPVIVLSAVRDESKVRQLVRHGISAYLAKPLRPLDVGDRIQEIVARIAAAAGQPSRSLAGLAERGDLRAQMISATEQVFGLMLGIEVLAVTPSAVAAPGDDIVRLCLRLEREVCDLEFSIAAPRATSERLTAQYLQAGDVITDDDVAATWREMATIISSRLQATLRQRGDEVTIGEPVVSRLGHGPRESDGMVVDYTSPTQDLRFTTTLRAVPASPRPTAAQDAPASASRTTRMDTPPPVDPEVIEMLASLQEPGEPDLVVELVTLFLRDTPERLRDLRTRPLDASQAARVAHAVKGSAGNLGAVRLQEVAGDLEQAGHRGESADGLATLVEAVFSEYARVEQHLQGILADRTGAGPTLRD